MSLSRFVRWLDSLELPALRQFFGEPVSDSVAITIYVALLDEGIDVWRPVGAIKLGDGLYRILPPAPDPNLETLEFQPGDVVRCELRTLSEGRVLVATARVGAAG